jgi:peroxiredoxin Q/BCP
MAEYGAFREKKMYGKSFLGVIRSTFIISLDGKIKKEWRKVKARGHVYFFSSHFLNIFFSLY